MDGQRDDGYMCDKANIAECQLQNLGSECMDVQGTILSTLLYLKNTIKC